MKKYIRLAIVVLALSFMSVCTMVAQDNTGQAAYKVLQRVVGERANDFIFQKTESSNGLDSYSYSAKDGKVIVNGTTGVAMARGAYDYLRNHGIGMSTWAEQQMVLPSQLPDDSGYSFESPYEFRYYFNVVTYGYSLPYWDWPRWEQELDWMALHGVNFPLALVGTEAIARRIWKKLGLTQAEIDEFSTGPAQLPFNRMGLLSNYEGPLSDAWHTDQIALQHKILARMRELGIHPITPAFAGFVPRGLLRIHPELKIHAINWNGCGFPDDNRCYMLSPDEPMFQQIGKAFIEEWEKEFGKNDYYIADSFNETEIPQTGKSVTELMADYGEAIYQSIKSGNPDAVWVIQGWMFGFQRDNWSKENVKALLSRVPDDKMIILDLACDYNACRWHNGMNYDIFNSFYNKRWIYSVIPNMGGKSAWVSPLGFYASGLADAQKSPNRGQLAGMGNAGEGIETNEVIYELTFDTPWHKGAIDVDDWLENYCKCRYGAYPEKMRQAWALFRESCFPKDYIEDHPLFSWQKGRTGIGSACSTPEFFEGVRLFLDCAEELGKSPLYRTDALELASSVLGGKAQWWFIAAQKGYATNNPADADKALATGLQMLTDLDRLLESHPYNRLRRWIDLARSHGVTPEEKNRFESNARIIVTTWGSTPINDYSCRLWSGLVRDFYRERMVRVFEGIKTGNPFNMSQWQNEWAKGTGISKIEPFADPVAEAVKLVKIACDTPVPEFGDNQDQ
jgi:alpha-N-acetylglucosaminidase